MLCGPDGMTHPEGKQFPDGRKYDEDDTEWEIMLCFCCGHQVFQFLSYELAKICKKNLEVAYFISNIKAKKFQLLIITFYRASMRVVEGYP